KACRWLQLRPDRRRAKRVRISSRFARGLRRESGFCRSCCPTGEPEWLPHVGRTPFLPSRGSRAKGPKEFRRRKRESEFQGRSRSLPKSRGTVQIHDPLRSAWESVLPRDSCQPDSLDKIRGTPRTKRIPRMQTSAESLPSRC